MDYLQFDDRSPLNMRRRAGQVTQPVVHELGLLKMPTPLLIGQKDTTAIGKDAAPPPRTRRGGGTGYGDCTCTGAPGLPDPCGATTR